MCSPVWFKATFEGDSGPKIKSWVTFAIKGMTGRSAESCFKHSTFSGLKEWGGKRYLNPEMREEPHKGVSHS